MTALLEDGGALDRFRAPLYTIAEAARYLGVPESTFGGWATGYRSRSAGLALGRSAGLALGRSAGSALGRPLLTTVARRDSRRDAVVPFIGLAEGLVLTAMRRGGVPLQRVRPALARLEDRLGVRHPLASRWLHTDGVEVLFDYAEVEDAAAGEAPDVVVVRSDQRVLDMTVESWRRIEFAEDGYARLLRLPAYRTAEVVVDPARGFGQPVFVRGGARVEDALSMVRAGVELETVAAEYRVPAEHLLDAVGVATPVAA
ncbi:MAG TPA: hypothetical protein VF612_12670 [Jatrophihabitans sp.]|jgi:uncharacterized protein (DUF433 family)|uniref:DUF433 domain-containing protein n=1 Tax=Jatrophihabitans sp. TaxID=1932789 RepID=UPI002F197833